jgi:hypothetical protein
LEISTLPVQISFSTCWLVFVSFFPAWLAGRSVVDGHLVGTDAHILLLGIDIAGKEHGIALFGR